MFKITLVHLTKRKNKKRNIWSTHAYTLDLYIRRRVWRINNFCFPFSIFPGEVFKENWGSDYRFSENTNHTFFSVFAIFFPSVTGIQAGANISGDLKNPGNSIPIGTLLALLISMISYVTFVYFAGGAALRDASGIVGVNGTAQCISQSNCLYGLHNSYSVSRSRKKYPSISI